MKKTQKISDRTTCPCGKQGTYTDCCSRYHSGSPAPTAEALMRSRYTAYVLLLEAYLLATWHPTTRPTNLELTTDTNQHWLGLDIKRHQSTGTDSAIVEFVARYKTNGRAYRLHEVSRFLHEDGCWYYLDGVFPDAQS